MMFPGKDLYLRVNLYIQSENRKGLDLSKECINNQGLVSTISIQLELATKLQLAKNWAVV